MQKRDSTVRLLPLLLLPLLASASASAQVHEDCLDATGMYTVGGHTAISVQSEGAIFFFGGPSGGDIYCGVPLVDTAIVGSGGNVALLNHAIGIGGFYSNAALASPDPGTSVNSFTKADQVFKFRVETDDPQSTTPVDVEFVTRHRFGGARAEVSGSGFATVGYTAEFAVDATSHISLFNFGFQWSTESLPIVEHDYYDLVNVESVPTNTDLYFKARIDQYAVAAGRTPPFTGSGGANLASSWSFEATTAADATIVFDYVNQLGLAPPQLDVVPEPGLAASLPFGLMLIAAVANGRDRQRSRRRRRLQF